MTPTDAALKEKYQRLVRIFAPVVFFDPGERFFPVDLPSAITASALYRLTGERAPRKAVLVKARSDVLPVSPKDLATADGDYFMTVANFTMVERPLTGDPPLLLPRISVEDVYDKYASGQIPAKLTVYATVCRARDVPNYRFVDTYPPAIGPLKDAFVISYYFYFPAAEASEYQREGDWSGISLLFTQMPDPDHLDTSLSQIGIVACYFRKEGPYYWAEPDGIRTWDKVEKRWDPEATDPKDTSPTHPEVYISRGLHNCYFGPTKTTTPTSWFGLESVEPQTKIEEGKYDPGDPSKPVSGEVDPWLTLGIFAHPWIAVVLSVCGAEEGGGRAQPGVGRADTVEPGGFEGGPGFYPTGSTPPSDRYPAAPPDAASRRITLNLQYVDLTNSVMANTWQYAGGWGASSTQSTTVPAPPGSLDPTPTTSVWSSFGGGYRPNLAPWVLWNLYFDVTFGSAGAGGVSGFDGM